jgi:hypothetical protein
MNDLVDCISNMDKEYTMTTIQIQSNLPFDTLLESLQQLSVEELAELTQHSARLHAQRRASNLSEAEAELLIKINSGIVPPPKTRPGVKNLRTNNATAS